MEFLWLIMPIGCMVMMLVGRPGKKGGRGCFQQHANTGEDLGGTGDDPERFDQALQRRASAVGLSPEDTERLRRILSATTDQDMAGHGAPVAHPVHGRADERVE